MSKHRASVAILLALGLAALGAPAQAGSLRIVSQPGVTVFWEGVELGATDPAGELLIERVPRGSYRVTLEKPGYEPMTKRVDIGEGRTTASLLLEAGEPTAEAGDATAMTENASQPPRRAAPTPGTESGRPPAGVAEIGEVAQPDAAPEVSAGERPTAEPESAPAPHQVAPAETSSGSSTWPLIVVAIAAITGWLGWRLSRARRLALDPALAIPDEPLPSPGLAAEEDVPSILRERLRQREKKLDAGPGRRRPRDAEPVIEVVDFEVLEEPP